MKKIVLSLFILSFLFFILKAQGTWTPRAPLPDSARGEGIGFSIGNCGYMGLGENFDKHPFGFYKDFWQFNPSTNLWTRKTDFPGRARVWPSTFVIGHKAFVVGGDTAGEATPALNECWMYDATTNKWTPKANFPSTIAYGVGFAIGGKGYVGLGEQGPGPPLRTFWAYDTTTNTWTSIANFSGMWRWCASAFGAGGKGYVCFGQDSLANLCKDIWEYDPVGNAWIQKANNPGDPIFGTGGFVIGNNIYVGTGVYENNDYSNAFWQFNTITDIWTKQANFPDIRCCCYAFSVADSGYMGLGWDTVRYIGYASTIYRFVPDSNSGTGINDIVNSNEITVYPNPVSQTLFINFSKQFIRPATLSIMDIAGRIVVSEQLSVISNQIAVDVSSLSSGMYFINIKNQDLYATQKFIKQ